MLIRKLPCSILLIKHEPKKIKWGSLFISEHYRLTKVTTI